VWFSIGLLSRRIQAVNRLDRLLSELTPGKVKKDITALQAKAILSRESRYDSAALGGR
jgi:transposase